MTKRNDDYRKLHLSKYVEYVARYRRLHRDEDRKRRKMYYVRNEYPKYKHRYIHDESFRELRKHRSLFYYYSHRVSDIRERLEHEPTNTLLKEMLNGYLEKRKYHYKFIVSCQSSEKS